MSEYGEGYSDENQSYESQSTQQDDDSDVELDTEFENGISIQISVDDLLADGYQIEPGDDEANIA